VKKSNPGPYTSTISGEKEGKSMDNSGIENTNTGKLIEDLSNPDIAVRRAAVRQLGDAGEQSVTPLIRSMHENNYPDFRWYAASALVLTGEPAIGPLILAMEDDTTPEFRRYAAAALGQLGEPAVDPLIEAFSRGDKEMREFIALALCRIGDPAIKPLQQLLHSNDAEMRTCAELVLWKMGERGVHALVIEYDPADTGKDNQES
jgi:HEAT repeat protein